VTGPAVEAAVDVAFHDLAVRILRIEQRLTRGRGGNDAGHDGIVRPQPVVKGFEFIRVELVQASGMKFALRHALFERGETGGRS